VLFRRRTPAAPLAEFVEDVWLYQGYVSPHANERILPSGTFELVINLAEDELRIYGAEPTRGPRRFSGAVVSGPYLGYFTSDAREEASLIGAHFRPGGAYAFLGGITGELADTHVNLRDLWGRHATELREWLLAAATPGARLKILEQALTARICGPLERHAAVVHALDAIERTDGRIRTRELVRQAALSERRFIDGFRREVGLTPKGFGRITRFQRALGELRRSEHPDWAELAVTCGYFDQSHLIRDFATFAGVSPADFHRREYALRERHTYLKPNHLPFLDRGSVLSNTGVHTAP
jgi:AraC-like DNA-binding protein